jgi:peptidoglycan/LPS O-acetylase OafA/YrhL
MAASVWLPLSRLSYSAYLVHIPLILVLFIVTDRNFYGQWANFVLEYVAILFLTFLCACILYLCVEAPLARLETMLGYRQR